MADETLQWLVPVLLLLFVLIVIIIALIICFKLRQKSRDNSQTKQVCNCSHSRANKAKRFFRESIFMTTSSKDTENRFYRCKEGCLCSPQDCKTCRIDSRNRTNHRSGILKPAPHEASALTQSGNNYY